MTCSHVEVVERYVDLNEELKNVPFTSPSTGDREALGKKRRQRATEFYKHFINNLRFGGKQALGVLYLAEVQREYSQS